MHRFRWLTFPERGGVFFGAAAFRAWVDDIEIGRFEDENLPMWENYGVYVCNLATSGGMPEYIFMKLAEMNQSHSYLAQLGDKIQKLLPNEGYMESRSLLWIQLEKLGGGMAQNGAMDRGIFMATMRDKEKRSKVSAALRDYAGRLDQAVALLKENVR